MSNTTYKIIAIFLVLAFCFWGFSIAIHDILSPENNLEFVAYVLKGDGSANSFSITNKNIINIIFYVAVVYETLIAVVLFIAAVFMLLNFRHTKFHYANNIATVGFGMALFKYFVLFVTVCAEWFYMWKTSEPSQIKAILLSNFAVLGLIFLNLNRRAGNNSL